MDQMIQSSAAMTETMLGDAEVMPGLGPVPLLQRQSASESRWTRPVPTSREAAGGGFPNRPFLALTKMKVVASCFAPEYQHHPKVDLR